MTAVADVLPLIIRQVSEWSGPLTGNNLVRSNYRFWPAAVSLCWPTYRTLVAVYPQHPTVRCGRSTAADPDFPNACNEMSC